jgi:hypothetical protein
MVDPFQIAAFTYLTKGLTRPAVDGLGEIVRDQLDSWRAQNLRRILEKADGKLALNTQGRVALNPKVVFKIAELGSLEDNAELQDMWAGLLSTSKGDDSNLHYVEILGGLTSYQALIIKCICTRVRVLADWQGLVFTEDVINLTPDELLETIGVKDIRILDQTLDDLHRKGLTDGQLYTRDSNAAVALEPTALLLQFYSHVSGSADPVDFYKAKIISGVPNVYPTTVVEGTSDTVAGQSVH